MARATETQPQAPRLPQRPAVMRAMAMLGVLLVVVPLASFGLDYLRDPRHLPLRAIRVTGDLRHLDRGELEAVVAGAIDGNFFTVDMAAIRTRVRQLPWVDQVSIRRAWPETLIMQVTEQVPLARWGKSALVNARGEVFAPESSSRVKGLAQLYGPPGSAPRVVEFYGLARARLQAAGLQVGRLGLDGRRDWVLELRGGIRLALGQDGEVERLDRFLGAYPQLVKDAEREPAQVDLRYAQGFAVSWRPRGDQGSATAATKAKEGSA